MCLLSNFSKNVFLCFQICIDGQTKLSLAVHCELSNLARPTMGNSNIRSEGIFLLFSHCYSQEKERKKGEKTEQNWLSESGFILTLQTFFQLTSSNEPSHLFFSKAFAAKSNQSIFLLALSQPFTQHYFRQKARFLIRRKKSKGKPGSPTYRNDWL